VSAKKNKSVKFNNGDSESSGIIFATNEEVKAAAMEVEPNV
jgi:hypothetical protein